MDEMKVEERNKEKREGGTTVNKERRNKRQYDCFSIAHIKDGRK